MKEKISIDDLVDIRTIKVDKKLPKEERILEYVRQIKNPYLYRCGKFIVRARFAQNTLTLEERLIKIAADMSSEHIISNHKK